MVRTLQSYKVFIAIGLPSLPSELHTDTTYEFKNSLIYDKLSIFQPNVVHNSLYSNECSGELFASFFCWLYPAFGFLPFADLSVQEACDIAHDDAIHSWLFFHYPKRRQQALLNYYNSTYVFWLSRVARY